MPPTKLSRREREKLRHRREILETACEVFAQKGFKKTTIQDISRKSEFSIASIYKHFDSKEDIYHSLIEQGVTRYHQALKRSVAGIKSPLEQLLACVETTVKVFGEDQAFSKFFLGEFRTVVDEGAEHLAKKSVDLYWNLITFYVNIIQKAREEGEVIDVPPLYLTISLVGNIWAFMTYWLHFSDQGFRLTDEDRSIIPKMFFGSVALKPLPKRYR